MKRYCPDNNPKIIVRTYDLDGSKFKVKLCKEHSQDFDFLNFVQEEKL